MLNLQFFVNCEKKVDPEITNFTEYKETSMEEKSTVRSVLYEHPELIDAFIKKNPEGFSKEELSIVAGWKNFIKGSFMIERFLKTHTIFILDDEVYGVHGLYESFEEIIHRSRLPFFADVVLLPFKGKIIYDGLLYGKNIFFGGGIKRNLKETYMRAKQNNRIIVSLDHSSQTIKKQQPASAVASKDWKPELDKLASKAKKLRGGASQPPLHSPAFSLLKASVELAQLAVENDPDLDALCKALRKVERATSKVELILDRCE